MLFIIILGIAIIYSIISIGVKVYLAYKLYQRLK